jgi:hypothetical protein
MAKTIVALDIECYTNYFLAIFKSTKGKMHKISMLNDEIEGDIATINTILQRHQIVTFNGDGYDLLILSAFLQGYSNDRLKDLSDSIIVDNIPRWDVNTYYPDLIIRKCDHIDLMGVTPLQASLKTYGCRIHSPKLQDLPIHPSAIIRPKQAELLEKYCENDVDVTLQIYKELLPQINLRAEIGNLYNMDMRSLSDAQIAERAIRSELQEAGVDVHKRTEPVPPWKYEMPDFITFESDELLAVYHQVCSATFTINDKGYAQLPDELDQVIEYAGAKYKLGIGGLHSQEKKQVIVPTGDQIMGEYDVASMYPSIILGQNLYPYHLDPKFCDVYRDIFNRRIAAKHAGDKVTADTLKIVLNSSYGKFGSKYSFLYAPELLVQTTLSGQLALLMLIERVTLAGAKVVSANTDGIVVLMDRCEKPHIDSICDKWTEDTTYVLEWTEYDRIYSRDVNSYLAFKGNEIKTKGAYEYGSIRKGYANAVCLDAVVAYLRDGTPIADTIRSTTDITAFLTMRGVKGGGKWREEPLGKVVRWYMSTDGEPIRYISNDNKVAGSDGAKPLMDLPDTLPGDIDYDLYIVKAEKLIKDLGL